MSAARVVALHRYPVKGLSPESLDRVDLEVGGTVPFDRAYAIENGPSGFDAEAPKHLPKSLFFALMRHERLARLKTAFEPATKTLTIRLDGRIAAVGALDTEAGRAAIEAFFAAEFGAEAKGPPRLLATPGFSFSDVPRKVLHVVNLETVRDLERRIGKPVDPLRFRANVHLDGVPAWSELDWVGARIDGPGAAFAGFHRTERCAATNVDPATGERDLAIPRTLMGLFGHTDLGLYVEVTRAGPLAVGDRWTVTPDPRADLPF